MKIRYELVGSFLFTLVLMVYLHNSNFYNAVDDINIQKKIETLLVTSISVFGAFLGFVIAAVSIIATILQFGIFKKLHKAGKSKELIEKFMTLIWITSIALAVAILTVFIFPDYIRAAVGMFTFTSALWIIAFFNCMRLFETLLKKAYQSESPKEANGTLIS